MQTGKMILAMLLLVAPLVPMGSVGATPPPEERGSDVDVQRDLEEARRALAEAARRVAELSAHEADRFVRNMEFEWVGPSRVRLGVVVDDAASHTDGVAISAVTPDGPAAAAGLQAGDLLLSVNGISLAAAGERPNPPVRRVRDALADVNPGDEVQVRYRRGRQTRNTTVAVAESLQHRGSPGAFMFGFGDGPRRMIEIPGVPPLPAFALRPLGDYELAAVDSDLGRYFGVERGLLVVRTGAENPLGLRAGDVILNIGGREPSSPVQAARILRSYEPGDTVTLDIMRDRERMTLEVTIPEPQRTGRLR